MKKPFTPAAVHRLTKLAVVLGLVFSAPAFSADYLGVYDSTRDKYILTVDSDGKITEGSAVGTTVQDGDRLSGNLKDAYVTISGGTMGQVYGGNSDLHRGGSDTSNNIVTISGGTINGEVNGGRSQSQWAKSTGHSVYISGGEITGNVFGGASGYAGVSIIGNTVDISGGTINGNVHGGQGGSTVVIYDNTVRISGDTTRINGNVYGGNMGRHYTNDPLRNHVEIKGGTIIGNVYGSYLTMSDNRSDVSESTVSISGGTIEGNVYGGYAGGRTSSTDNVITIDGTKNTVTITGDIIGGAISQSYGIDVKDNEVNLINANLTGSMVYGGTVYIYDSSTQSYSFSGINTSNTITAKGVNTVKGIDGFKTLELTVGKVNSDKGDSKPVLTATNVIDLTDKTITLKDDTENQVDNTHATVYLLSSNEGVTFSNTTLESNSTFVKTRWEINESTITESDTLSGSLTTLALKNNNVEVSQDDNGDSDDNNSGNTDTDKTDDNKTIVITPEQTATENTKTLSESLLGSVAMVNQGAEFIADEAMASINAAIASGKGTFGVINGGSSRYQTGSHVDVDTVSLAAGIAGKVLPNTTLAGFVEAGWASSTSHVSHAKGSGEHEYYGVGIAAKHTFSNPFYLDGSVRLGVAKTAFDGRYTGDKAHYNTDMFYTSAHVGGGYVFNLAEKTNLDLYGRYTVTWLESDSVKLHDKADTRFHMDSTTTHAVRGGLRLTGEATETLRWKVGLAYEHIFDGDADGQINGLALDTPTLEGDTGIGELGLSIKPSANSPWTFDVTAKGYVGDREGFSGNLRAVYAF